VTWRLGPSSDEPDILAGTWQWAQRFGIPLALLPWYRSFPRAASSRLMGGKTDGHCGGGRRRANSSRVVRESTLTDERNRALLSEGMAAPGRAQLKRPGVDADHLADIPRQWMLNRPSPLNPVIFPHAPQRRNTDRGICRSEIVGMEQGKHHIASPSERIKPARPPLLRRKVSAAT
jgi:hypothetical protein